MIKRLFLTLCFSFCLLQLCAQDNSLESLWNEMAFGERSSCLVGTQYSFDREGKRFDQTIFNSKSWKTFLTNDKEITTKFLVTKLNDTTITKVHVCPFNGATNGELAAYGLQQLHQFNWYDFPIFNQYKEREFTSATDNAQAWLRNILADDKKRNILKELFLQKL